MDSVYRGNCGHATDMTCSNCRPEPDCNCEQALALKAEARDWKDVATAQREKIAKLKAESDALKVGLTEKEWYVAATREHAALVKERDAMRELAGELLGLLTQLVDEPGASPHADEARAYLASGCCGDKARALGIKMKAKEDAMTKLEADNQKLRELTKKLIELADPGDSKAAPVYRNLVIEAIMLGVPCR
jgi:hypothetical protein